MTRKISAGAAAIALGRQETLTLGRLDVRRDWGRRRTTCGPCTRSCSTTGQRRTTWPPAPRTPWTTSCTRPSARPGCRTTATESRATRPLLRPADARDPRRRQQGAGRARLAPDADLRADRGRDGRGRSDPAVDGSGAQHGVSVARCGRRRFISANVTPAIVFTVPLAAGCRASPIWPVARRRFSVTSMCRRKRSAVSTERPGPGRATCRIAVDGSPDGCPFGCVLGRGHGPAAAAPGSHCEPRRLAQEVVDSGVCEPT